VHREVTPGTAILWALTSASRGRGPVRQARPARCGPCVRSTGKEGERLVRGNAGSITEEDGEEGINAAVAAYRASIDSGEPLPERKLAAMFGRTSCRRARYRMAEARGRAVG
jgi:hypothetical protein